MNPEPESTERSGFIGVAGRPNAGKSTLVNRIVGRHVAIVSPRPQTTRRVIRGIRTDASRRCQLVLVDLPGVQRPRDVLTRRMQRSVEQELAGADGALIVLNGEQGVGPGDTFIAKAILGSKYGGPVICAVNKLDRLSRAQTLEALTAAAELEGVDEVFPISAKTGEGVEPLVDRLCELMPQGPNLYPADDVTDLSREIQVAELIREQVLMRMRQEIPHAVEVSIDEIEELEGGDWRVRAEIWPENDSQKAMLIGRSGQRIKEIGTAARRRLEQETGRTVHLQVEVRTRRKWRRDEGLLDRLGIE